MIICAAGDTHGGIDRLYQEVLAFECALSVQFDWVLHVGDVGIWPDPQRIDKATRNHEGAGDFPAWWAERRPAPRQTVFVKGNHEDFGWLDAQPQSEILPGLFYLRNGDRTVLGKDGEQISVGGLGGCHGPADFERDAKSLQGYAKRHYTRGEIAKLAGGGRLDVLLVHDAPRGVVFEKHRRGAGYVSEAAGLDEILVATRPRVCLFGHHHTRLSVTVSGVPCFGVNKAPFPGSLIALEVSAHGVGFRLLDEWPHAIRSPASP